MAVTDKTIDLTGANNQVVWTHSSNTELRLLFVHLIVTGIDSEITISYTQGNINNNIDGDTNVILGTDILVPIKDCEGVVIEDTFDTDGAYVVAIDTFFGKYANIKIDKKLATTGIVRVVSNTVKKFNNRLY